MHATALSTFSQSPFLNFRDPAVAKRIRFFSLEPHISKTFDQNTPASDSHDRQRRPGLWKNGVNFLRKHVGIISKKLGDQEESRYPSTLRGFELALIDAVSGWSNVQEFSVIWWDSTELRQLESFLLPAWSTFGPNLRKVTLSGNPVSIRTLLSSAGRLPSLRELSFELSRSQVDDEATLEDIIAPFINSFSTTLEALSISSREAPVDLSQFFLKLGVFPCLRHFTARAPFDDVFSSTPDGLTHLLCNHSHTLTSVGLHLKPSAYINPLPEVAFRGWMESINAQPHILANLTTLKMYPGNPDPFGLMKLFARNRFQVSKPTAFAIFLDLLRRSVDTLTELAIQESFLSFDDVESVLSTFASRPPPLRLTILYLAVESLDLHLFNLLVQELPCLHKLSLNTITGSLFFYEANQ